jgi:hypothetical protein
MTLNITVLSHDSAFQSSDARLSVWDPAARAYRIHDVKAHKQVPVFGRSWSASVTFTGVGRTRSVDVSEWLANAVSPLFGVNASFEDLIGALLGADDWLQWVPRADRRHTFTVAAFVGDMVVAVLVSNFENVLGRCEECGKLGEGSMEGWRAMLGTDIDDENAPTETYLFCPACADREFGPSRSDRRRSSE